MKIKELHIRNIAAIEKADIDFDKELVDAITGRPSNIFLISGDTGTGKSVLLDAISMALYKNTPRLDDVSNRKKNSYTDVEGNVISIYSIEQYTRLGISEKDECYSEVVFEGNDGQLYHARLRLGITRSNRKDSNGRYPMHLSNPSWEVKVGNNDWEKTDGQIFIYATGLSYLQFRRMAMLAQGQFAAFLTGKKEERESILEQLTNTSKFSVYGTAISNLYSRAKGQMATAETAYKTEQSHTVPNEDRESLSGQLESLKAERSKKQQDYNHEYNRLGIVDSIMDLTTERTKVVARKSVLEELINGKEYQEKKQLVNDWDNTYKERQILNDKQQAAKQMKAADQQLIIAKSTFNILYSDMLFRNAEWDKLCIAKAQLADWIDAKAEYDNLLTHVSAVDYQLNQYSNITTKIADTKHQIQKEKDLTDILLENEKKCQQTEYEAKSEIKTRQDAIDVLQAERNRLNPASINKQKDVAVRQQIELEKLQDRIASLIKNTESAEDQKRKLDEEEKRLEQLNSAYQKAQSIYEQSAAEEESTHSLLNTMQMSVEQTMVEVRRRLREAHAENCPLCGQPLDHLHLNDNFQQILTPLSQREEEAKERLLAASRQRDLEKSAYDKALGALNTKKKDYNKATENNLKEGEAVRLKAIELALDPEHDLTTQINDSLAELKGSIVMLNELQQKAEALQTQINQLTVEKKPFDKAAQKAGIALLDAHNSVTANANLILNLEQSLTELEVEASKLNNDISSLLTNYCNDWAEDIGGIRSRIGKDADEYVGKKKQLEDFSQKASSINMLLHSISSISDAIKQKQKEWTIPDEPLEHPTDNIHQEWNQLYALVEQQQLAYIDAMTKMQQAQTVLEGYYEASGKQEEDLLNIMSQMDNVSSARKYINDIDAEHKSRCEFIDETDRKIVSLRSQLNAENPEEVPTKESIKEIIDTLSRKLQEITSLMGGIEEKLKTIKENDQKLIIAKEEYDKAKTIFDKWDRMNSYFGGTRLRTIVQTYILRPLLNNANIYLEKITDRYTLTCSEENEQLSILVLDSYNKNQIRSATVLSGGERFMISLSLSLALSSLNRQDMNVNILFIDEGFGTLDENNLNSVMSTLEKLQDIAGQSNRRVGIISHREELADRIPVKINVRKKGEGRSIVDITNE